MAAYLTSQEATNRLALYGLDHSPTTGALDAASDRLDAFRSFIGTKYGGILTQEREFPRTINVVGDTLGQVPERVKRWVALEAYKVDVGEEPGLVSISNAIGSKSWDGPRHSKPTMLQKGLLSPYLARRAGSITSVPIERA